MKSKILLVGSLLFTVLLFAQPAPPGGQRWVKVEALSDEFNGNGINGSKWFDYHPFWKGRLPSQFKRGNATQSGGYLRLKSTLHRNPNSVGDKFKDHWVDAAAVVSKGKTARPGYYYEAQFKASNLSMTSSFWFRVGAFSEIDVIEHIGNPVNNNKRSLERQFHANTHYFGKHAGLRNKAAEWQMPGRGRDNFYRYGFWWKNPNELLFYHNGTQRMKIIPRVPLNENLHMIFDTEVFPFATAGVANIGLPRVSHLNDNSKNTMLVNWVRTYRLVAGGGGAAPPSGGGNGGAPVGRVISLRKSGGDRKFVTGEGNGSSLRARGGSVGAWEKFRLEDHPKGGVALRALSNNKFVQVPNNDANAAVRNSGSFKGDWERFTWKSKGNGKAAIQSFHTKKWLQAAWNENNGIVRARGASDQGWETFDWKFEAAPKNLLDNSTNIAGVVAAPNPATSYVELTGTSDIDVSVNDLSGALVPARITPSSDNSIMIDFDTSVAPGQYIITTAEGQSISVIKK